MIFPKYQFFLSEYTREELAKENIDHYWRLLFDMQWLPEEQSYERIQKHQDFVLRFAKIRVFKDLIEEIKKFDNSEE
jgi:hypothetical protein